MGPILRIGCSLFLMFALVTGLFYHHTHSRPPLANADDAPAPARPLGLLAGLIGAGGLISFLLLLLGV